MFQLTCPGKQCVKNDVLSGLTVALALVPEAVAFAFVAASGFAAAISPASIARLAAAAGHAPGRSLGRAAPGRAR